MVPCAEPKSCMKVKQPCRFTYRQVTVEDKGDSTLITDPTKKKKHDDSWPAPLRACACFRETVSWPQMKVTPHQKQNKCSKKVPGSLRGLEVECCSFLFSLRETQTKTRTLLNSSAMRIPKRHTGTDVHRRTSPNGPSLLLGRQDKSSLRICCRPYMQSSRDHSHFDNEITRTLPKLSNIKRTCRWYIWQTSHLSFACKIPIRSPPLKTSKHGASMWSEGSWWNQHEPTWIMKCSCVSGDLLTSMQSSCFELS